MKMNANTDTAASASFNITYNSLERRFAERGTADAVRKMAAEQEENERKTAALAPDAYRLGERKECREWNAKYKTGMSEDGFYMSVSDYERCFRNGMGYSPKAEVKLIEMKAEAAAKRRNDKKRTIDKSVVVTKRPAEPYSYDGNRCVSLATAQYRESKMSRWFPRIEIVPVKERRFRTLPIGAMAMVLLFALLLALPITLSVMIKERSDTVIAAEAKLAELDGKVTSLENSLSVKDDLAEIRRIAVEEYGMISVDISTTHYLALGGKDRIEAFSEDDGNTGVMALLSALGIGRGK